VAGLKFSRVVGGTPVADSPNAGGAMSVTAGAYTNGGSSNNNGIPVSMIWVDTPATVAPVTYRVYMKGNGTAQIAFGTCAEGNTDNYNVVSTITAMEIAA